MDKEVICMHFQLFSLISCFIFIEVIFKSVKILLMEHFSMICAWAIFLIFVVIPMFQLLCFSLQSLFIWVTVSEFQTEHFYGARFFLFHWVCPGISHLALNICRYGQWNVNSLGFRLKVPDDYQDWYAPVEGPKVQSLKNCNNKVKDNIPYVNKDNSSS